MRNEGQRPQGSGRNNGFMRSFSSYLRIVSNGASNVASTVKSAGVSVASSLADRDEDAARDQYYPSLNRSRCCMKGICTGRSPEEAT
ncbi:autophagy-related protein 18g-like isoform X2 [Asparagus officinalis]|uniref:autophagy-related protein 18g-like isoform X2 n=1 Tax=Asparagus officinalis TaxID=4686 RepID=UPI00098E6F37|nr:autophagy-related protein 18g-like isoform X2 [Asparagus officinalis]